MAARPFVEFVDRFLISVVQSHQSRAFVAVITVKFERHPPIASLGWRISATVKKAHIAKRTLCHRRSRTDGRLWGRQEWLQRREANAGGRQYPLTYIERRGRYLSSYLGSNFSSLPSEINQGDKDPNTI
jgi:hypothetical protein